MEVVVCHRGGVSPEEDAKMKTYRDLALAALGAFVTASVAWGTTFTTTSPTGGALPSGVTEVGGVVIDMQGASGTRIVSQLAASTLFDGYANSGTPASYQGNPMTIGIQGGFSPAIIAALGGGLNSLAVRITLEDGDTGPGNFDDDQNTLLINGVNAGNFSDIVTVQTSADGLTEISQNASGGFRNGLLDTGFFVVSGPAELAAIFAALSGSGQMVLQLQDVDPNDNYFNFTGGVDGGLINVGTGPTIDPGNTTTGRTREEPTAPPAPITIVDAGAMASVLSSALPAAVAHRTAMLGFSRVAVRDLNARLFRSRSRTAAEREEESARLEEASVADRFHVFASGDFSTSDTEPNNGGLGFSADTLSASGGFEYFLNGNFNLGLAATLFEADGDLDNDIASIETTGLGISPYATYIRGPLHVDALYSLGFFQSTIERNTGSSTAEGETDTLVHALELNAGYNFEFSGFVAGPIAGVEYRHGTIDDYDEDECWAAVAYGEQTFESFISRLGAQLSFPIKPSGIRVVPQIRVAWEHEYLDDTEDITASLLTSPITIINGSQVTEGAPYSTTLETATLEEDYLSAGAGVLIEVGNSVQILLDYEGHFFRGDSDLHMAAARIIVGL
jgi:hypothetical protein